MEISERTSGDVTILDLRGKLTIGDGNIALDEAIRSKLSAGAKKLVLNLKDVTKMDSSGVGALVGGYTSASSQGATLKLLNIQPKVNDLLNMTHLLSVFDLYDDETEAVASFK